MNIVGKKYLYFFISFLLIVPGLFSLTVYGLKLSIDFTGGSRMEYQLDGKQKDQKVKLEEIIEKAGTDVTSIQEANNNRYIIRTKPIDQKIYGRITSVVKKEYKDTKENGFETIGPTLGKETSLNALKAIFVASFLIVLYISWSFRLVPKPASSWRFGICAITALIHDVLVVVGLFSLLGHFWGIEVDSLFVTAILTVIGFSVHDTIVVFDRIRENLKRMGSGSFAYVVNESILQTFTRSLNTSLTVLLVLFTMLLFGGESIRWFVVALFVGILSGTYSSIFNAAPLLVIWHEWSEKRSKK